MTEAKHTPGPWEIDTETRPAEVCVVHGLPASETNGQQWAYIRGAIGYWSADDNENMANARLIAAAPELLEALDRLALTELASADYFDQLGKSSTARSRRECVNDALEVMRKAGHVPDWIDDVATA